MFNVFFLAALRDASRESGFSFVCARPHACRRFPCRIFHNRPFSFLCIPLAWSWSKMKCSGLSAFWLSPTFWPPWQMIFFKLLVDLFWALIPGCLVASAFYLFCLGKSFFPGSPSGEKFALAYSVAKRRSFRTTKARRGLSEFADNDLLHTGSFSSLKRSSASGSGTVRQYMPLWIRRSIPPER